MINAIYKRRKRESGDPVASKLLEKIHSFRFGDLKNIQIETVLRTEGINRGSISKLEEVFVNPIVEERIAKTRFNKNSGIIIEVTYRRAITDPEMESIMHAAGTLGIRGLKWARISTRYLLEGVSEEVAHIIAEKVLYNKTVQTLLLPGKRWSTLIPQGTVVSVNRYDISRMDLSDLQQLSEKKRLFLSDEQLLAIKDFYSTEDRLAIDAELEMIAAAWSDHCSHTTMNALGLMDMLKDSTAEIDHPLVISAYHDNSGVMRFYNGWALNAKGETHISPTSVAPYGGIMTKHGGVIRDILFTGQGAWVLWGSTVMGTCDPAMGLEFVPEGALHPRTILMESILGTADYTNPMGIPMAWSQYLLHHNNVKCLALGHSVGILPESRAQKGTPHTKDICLLVGGGTGNDGLHGATVSSSAMTNQTAVTDASHVQIGHPIIERLMMEAIPHLRDNDCIRACTDCGAAGLSSAVGEIAEGVGVLVNLAWVPLKCASMAPWQIWISESQERGVLAVPPEKISLALEILKEYGVPATVIGVFTDTNRCQVLYAEGCEHSCANGEYFIDGHPFGKKKDDGRVRNKMVVDLPYEFLMTDTPLPNIEVREPEDLIDDFDIDEPCDSSGWIDLVRLHLCHYNICDQSTAAHQFDMTVQGKTVVPYIGGKQDNMPDEISVMTPLRGEMFGAGVANGVNQFYAEVDPFVAGQNIVIQAVAKLVAAGFSPCEIVLNCNVYTPSVLDNPEAAWRLTRLVKGYASASVALGIPIFSGKDSSSGTFKGKKVINAPLTLDVLALGRIFDVRHVVRKDSASSGDTLVLFRPGLKKSGLGGSVLYDLYGKRGSMLPQVDVEETLEGFQEYHALVQRGVVTSRSAISEGGLIRRLFEMSLGNGLGCSLDLVRPMSDLFEETPGAIVFSVCAGTNLTGLGDVLEIGTVMDEPAIKVFQGKNCMFSAGLDELGSQWSKTFSEVAA